MNQQNQFHTRPGMQLVRRLAEEGERIFTTARARELAPETGLTDGYVRQALHRLAKGGWLIRLRKGLYALSSSLAGVNPAHEFEVAMVLVKPAAISHWTALHYHHLTEQAPRQVFVLTTTDASRPLPKSRLRGTAHSTRPDRAGGRATDAG